VFGDLAGDADFRRVVVDGVAALFRDGVRATLARVA
jgi:hypothetical protein